MRATAVTTILMCTQPLPQLLTLTRVASLAAAVCVTQTAQMQVLIDTLAQSKVTFNNIERKVKEAAKTQEIIARTRRGYAPVAFRASQLFFCIADLGSVDPMYQVTNGFLKKN